MDRDFWLQRWEEGSTGWHEGQVNEYLARFAARLLTEPRRVVFVPLCGMAHDMAWLAAQGHRVIGVELSEIAARRFFEVEGIDFTRVEDGEFQRLSGGGVEILVGDVFDLTPAHLAAVNAVFDRGSLIALPPSRRSRYAALLNRLLPAGTAALVVTLSYDQAQMDGPPFSVDESQLRALFEQRFDLQLLASADVLDKESKFRDRGVTSLMERAWLLQS